MSMFESSKSLYTCLRTLILLQAWQQAEKLTKKPLSQRNEQSAVLTEESHSLFGIPPRKTFKQRKTPPPSRF